MANLILFSSPAKSVESNCLSLSSLQYLESSSKLIPLDSNFSVEFDFFLRTDGKNYSEIISQGGQPNSFYIGVDPNLSIRAGDTWLDTGTKFPLRNWTHIAITHSQSNEGKLYINGSLIFQKSNYILNPNGRNTRVGAQWDESAGERIDGCIDNLKIWKSVRTSDQINSDMKVNELTPTTELVASYTFDSVSGSNIVESQIGSNNSFVSKISVELLPNTNPYPAPAPQFLGIGGLVGSQMLEGGPGFYVTANFQTPIPDNFRSGFGWYSTLWPISPNAIDNFQLGLSSTWIVPDNRTVGKDTAQKLCSTSTNTWVKNAASSPNSGTYGLYLFQTIEGSLGWWGNEKFRTAFPKYMANITQNCYTTELATPGWGFFTNEPTDRSKTGLIQLSNQIIMPPDGMTFEEDLEAPQLGITWHILKLPRFDHAFGSRSGDNSWTLFMNTSNFKGPIAFVAPQFWADGSLSNPLQANISMDKRAGEVGGLASEWNSIPYYKLVNNDGKIYTKIPELQFPVDASGNFVISRDFNSYSSNAIRFDFQNSSTSLSDLPKNLLKSDIFTSQLLGTSSQVYQEGKTLGNLSSILSAKSLDNGYAYGFSASTKSGMVKIPQYFVQSTSTSNEITTSAVPNSLVRSSFNSEKVSSFVYTYPSWWDQSPKASDDLITKLNDGSTVVYRWYKFVDQPALQRFELTSAEKEALQSTAEKIQKEWANTAMMQCPTRGTLASFDDGMIVSPPKGFEFGYVPIVIKQYASSNVTKQAVVKGKGCVENSSNSTSSPSSTSISTPLPTPKTLADPPRKITITCIKGTIVKKVIAVKPTCPAGYKKK